MPHLPPARSLQRAGPITLRSGKKSQAPLILGLHKLGDSFHKAGAMNTATLCHGEREKLLQPTHPWILLSQDDGRQRESLANSLRSDGFWVSEAKSDQDLLTMLVPTTAADGQPITPALVVADVETPGAAGIRVLSHVRRANPTVPVILMTAFGSEELVAQTIRLGAATVLDKPIDIHALRVLIHKLLPGRKSLALGPGKEERVETGFTHRL